MKAAHSRRAAHWHSLGLSAVLGLATALGGCPRSTSEPATKLESAAPGATVSGPRSTPAPAAGTMPADAASLVSGARASRQAHLRPSHSRHEQERPSQKELEDVSRRLVGPSLVRVIMADGGDATGFACAVPGLGCTARHVVNDQATVKVRAPDGRTVDATVLGVHPSDDLALLDLRALNLPPLPMTHLDSPPDGVMVCRLGHPPSHPVEPFLRCDPLGGIMLETSARNDGTVTPRLVHLGIGFKGDSGAPLFDPATGLVVGIHVSEVNGSGRAAVGSAVHDLLVSLRELNPWMKRCAREGSNDLAKRTLLLSCAELVEDARASHFRHMGGAMLAMGRRSEALGAFDEAIELDPEGAMGWLWRALVYPQSAHARDDAAFAFRLDSTLRDNATLGQYLPPAFVASAKALRDEVAPRGVRLATLIADGGCAGCPQFCEAARRAKLPLWAVEGANHVAAQHHYAQLTPTPDAGAGPIVALDDKAAVGCGSLTP